MLFLAVAVLESDPIDARMRFASCLSTSYASYVAHLIAFCSAYPITAHLMVLRPLQGRKIIVAAIRGCRGAQPPANSLNPAGVP